MVSLMKMVKTGFVFALVAFWVIATNHCRLE